MVSLGQEFRKASVGRWFQLAGSHVVVVRGGWSGRELEHLEPGLAFLSFFAASELLLMV